MNTDTIEKIKDRIKEIPQERIFKHGIFHIAEVKDPSGIIGRGISRKSVLDKNSEELGKKIALGRAYKALKLKKQGKPVREWYLG